MDEMDEILGEFIAESCDDIERLDEAVVALTMYSLPDVLRTLHTIKGTSGFFGLSELESVAHRGEALLQQVIDGDVALDDSVRDEVNDTIGSLRSLLAGIHVRTGPSSASAGVAAAAVGSGVGAADADGRLGGLLNDHKVASARDVFSALESASEAAQEIAPAPVPRVGDLLIARGLVTKEDVDAAIEAQRAGDARHLGEILVDHGVVAAADVFEALNAQSTARAGAADSSVRVDVALLDELLDVVTGLAEVCDEVATHVGYDATAQRLVALTGQLQQGLMRTRMQPIGEVFEKFPRAVRTLESLCGKQVRVEVRGAELELDRTVIEAVKGPLTHLVRNAVGHGIEDPADRVAAGKPAVGTLTLSAFEDDALAHVQVSDDGAGLDLGRLRRRAVAMGLLSDADANALLDADAAELIFSPGLSTAAEVSTISGRGVGMDVVKTSVEQLSGTVAVTTTPGQGTTFTLSFPPSLALVPALVVADNDATFVIPRRSIVEVFALSRTSWTTTLSWRDGDLPLMRAGGVDTMLRNPTDTDVVVVVAVGERHVGVLVTDVVDAQDLVVKPGTGGGVSSRVAVTRNGALAHVLDAATLELGYARTSMEVSA